MKFLKLKLIFIFIVGSLVVIAQSPDITQLEYYFDTDPGFGNGTQVIVAADSITSTTFNLDISLLEAGTHYAFVRAMDENGRWSFVHQIRVVKVSSVPGVEIENIAGLEYFFDTDPGFGNGIPISVVNDSITISNFNIDISGLEAGYHKVYFRSQDESGKWSFVFIHNVIKVSDITPAESKDIVGMEYYFDSDPGFGNGTPVAITTATVTNTSFSVDISGLDHGYHKVYFRSMDETGLWSLNHIKTIVKVSVEAPSDAPDILSLEYFIDEDPGFGNGTEVPLLGDPVIDHTFYADLSMQSPGDYDLYVRALDENNVWSFIDVIPFTISEVDLKAYLEGPYSGSDMQTDLNQSGDLPLSQPFNVAPWDYNGSENVAAIPNSDVVDWVLLETRNADDALSATPETMSSRYAAFVLKDGSIVNLDGSANLPFNAQADTNNFVIVYHRNHLGILSAADLNYSGGIFSYDFSSGTGQAYNTGQKDLGSGVYGLKAGDANSDGIISELDLDEKWDLKTGGQGYLFSDLNLDGQVNNQDKNDVWLLNFGEESVIPE